ncbi:MAG: hypothetical protein JWO49_1273 [Arthrobacter sp.]|nr:hypothetical protein [Arthrobacter sp.]
MNAFFPVPPGVPYAGPHRGMFLPFPGLLKP